MKNTKHSEFINAITSSDDYLFEEIKLDFSMQLEKLRKVNNITYTEIANRVETSPAYISKVFRGDANFTIESMQKLASAVNGKLSIKILEKNSEVDAGVWLGKINNIVHIAANKAKNHVPFGSASEEIRKHG